MPSRTKITRLSALFLFLGVSSAAQAADYKTCKIVNGKIFSCDGSWYQGQLVVYK